MRVLHAADLHLDSPFRGLGAGKGRQRRQESRELLDRLADLANSRRAELVLLSGDLFDGAEVYRETLEQLRAALGRIRCPVFIAPGNHDPYTSQSPYQGSFWPENVHIFSAPQVEAVALEGCTVYGAAFTAPEQREGLLAGFTAPERGGVSLMCLHGDTSGGIYNPIDREDIARSGLDYLALGHIHQRSGLLRQGGTCYAYPGCLEGRGFDETGEKGVLLGDVERGRVRMDFVPLCRRRYESIEADCTGRSVREAVEAALASVRKEDILRVVLTGERETAVEIAEIERTYEGRCFHLTVRDRTYIGEDVWSRAGEDSLRGLFLQELRARYDAADSEEARARVAAVVRLGLAAMDHRDL